VFIAAVFKIAANESTKVSTNINGQASCGVYTSGVSLSLERKGNLHVLHHG
jgi:hypothetical protein